MRVALAFSLLLLGTALAGCIGDLDDGSIGSQANDRLSMNDLPGPDAAVYERGGEFSYTLTEGLYDALPGIQVFLPSTDGTMLDAGVFLPDIEGCDWEAGSLPAHCKVPVVMDVGPYYSPDQDTPTTVPAERLGRFLIENLVPHGYAVVQASVRGTGLSDGCNDFLGPLEQQDVDSFVTHFGEAAWSNGNVGLIGRSYDGTTPWEAATFGNPHLKTIVPISGLSNVGEMYWRNGSSEWRAPVLGTIYTGFGLDDGRSPQQQAMIVCPQTAEHPAWGSIGYVNGGYDAFAADMPYWTDRNYQPRVLKNYEGSVWVIHGLQDWNVDPHMAFPFANQLAQAGLDVKVWAGQWEHNYPDRGHDHLRWDWAETVKVWFDRYLKGLDVDTGPAFETEDNYGNWRVVDAWPPQEVDWTTLHLSTAADYDGNEALTKEPGEPGEFVLADSFAASTVAKLAGVDCLKNARNDGPPDNGLCVSFTTEPLTMDKHIIGLPRLHVTVTPSAPGGQLYAELYEITANDEHILVGHAQMDLRYHAGGLEQQIVVPGVPLVAKMEFLPLDVLVHEGSQLGLVLRQSNGGVLTEPLPSVHQTSIIVAWGDGLSTLQLPIGDAGNVHYVSEGVDPQSTWPN